jgi:predicted amidohydrolase
MKIGVVQAKALKGDISGNINNHKKLIHLAVLIGADMVIFPELSITGYEPTLARELATDQDDSRFNDFQQMSDERQVTIGVGMPIKSYESPIIGMVIFQPNKPRQTYFKKYIHADEESIFLGGQDSINIIGDGQNIGLAICYELSVPQHSEDAYKNGAQIYIASVAKTPTGVEKAINTLADIAAKYDMTVLLSNCVGPTEDYLCGGRSSVWNNTGELLAQLNDNEEGMLLVDTDTQQIIEQYL